MTPAHHTAFCSALGHSVRNALLLPAFLCSWPIAGALLLRHAAQAKTFATPDHDALFAGSELWPT